MPIQPALAVGRRYHIRLVRNVAILEHTFVPDSPDFLLEALEKWKYDWMRRIVAMAKSSADTPTTGTSVGHEREVPWYEEGEVPTFVEIASTSLSTVASQSPTARNVVKQRDNACRWQNGSLASRDDLPHSRPPIFHLVVFHSRAVIGLCFNVASVISHGES